MVFLGVSPGYHVRKGVEVHFCIIDDEGEMSYTEIRLIL